MMATLVLVTIVAVVLPIARSTASARTQGNTPVLVVSDGLSATLYTQALAVATALMQTAPTDTSQTPAAFQGLEQFPGGALVPRPLLTAAAQVLVRGALADPEGQRGLVMQLQEPVGFRIHEGGLASAVFSTQPTVGAALTALDVGYNSYDRIMPSPETPLTAGVHVYVDRATAVDLKVGAREKATVYTHVESVAELLTEQRVELSEGDRLTPDPSTPLRDGLAVSVTRVNEVIEYDSTPIPYSTIYRDDPSLPQGENVVVQAGVDGYVQHEYAVIIENDQEVSRELISDTIVAPDHRIVAQGTAVVAAAVAEPDVTTAVAEPDTTAPVAETEGGSECARPLNVWATWYTAASAGGSGRTATGTTVHKGTVAVDPRVIPLGTRMHIPGYGYGVAEDTGGSIIGNKIDLGYAADDVKDWGTGYVEICLLN